MHGLNSRPETVNDIIKSRISQALQWLLLLLLLLSRFSRVRLCSTPQTAAHQALLSLGFSRQEHWSGLPFPSPMHESEVTQLCLTLSDPMDCSPPGSSVHGIFQADSAIPMQGAQVWFLVKELRSHMLCGMAKIKKVNLKIHKWKLSNMMNNKLERNKSLHKLQDNIKSSNMLKWSPRSKGGNEEGKIFENYVKISQTMVKYITL